MYLYIYICFTYFVSYCKKILYVYKHVHGDSLYILYILSFFRYFNVTFRGSPQNPTKEVVELTTAPTTGTATHWGQQPDTQNTWRPVPDVRVISMFRFWEHACCNLHGCFRYNKWESSAFQCILRCCTGDLTSIFLRSLAEAFWVLPSFTSKEWRYVGMQALHQEAPETSNHGKQVLNLCLN